MVDIANENMANAIRLVAVERGSIRATSRWSPSAAPGRCTPREIADAIGIADGARPAAPGPHARRSARCIADRRVDRGLERLRALGRRPTPRRGRRAVRRTWSATRGRDFARPGLHGEDRQPSRPIACATRARTTSRRSRSPTASSTTRCSQLSLERFHELHHEFYGYWLDGEPVELVDLLVTAARRGGGAAVAARSTSGGRTAAPPDAEERTADVHFADGGFRPRRRSSARSVAGRRGDASTGPLHRRVRWTRRRWCRRAGRSRATTSGSWTCAAAATRDDDDRRREPGARACADRSRHADVINNAFVNVCREMGIAMMRTATRRSSTRGSTSRACCSTATAT